MARLLPRVYPFVVFVLIAWINKKSVKRPGNDPETETAVKLYMCGQLAPVPGDLCYTLNQQNRAASQARL